MNSLSEIPLPDLISELAARLTLAAAPYVIEHGTERTQLLDLAGKKIVHEVAKAFAIMPQQIMGRSKVRRIARARQVAMAGLWQMGFSSPEIGVFFSRDHATILHAITRTRAVRTAL